MEIHKDIIFLDTSIFESSNFLKGHQLQKLGNFSKESVISVKITEITYYEILSRIKKNLTHTKNLFRKTDKLFDQEGKILKNLNEYIHFYPMPRINVDENYEKIKVKLDEFLSECKIEIISTETASIREVFDLYFKLEKPFGEGQKKSEFPDAFTINSIEKWVEQNNVEISVLATDNDLIDYIPISEKINMVSSLSEYLESITEKHEKNKAKIEFIKTETLKVGDAIERQLNQNLHDTIAYNLYDKIKDDPYMVELEYEPAEFKNTIIVSSIITDLDDDSVSVEFIVDTDVKMQLNYEDVSMGIYDKEDGQWFNVVYVNEEKIYSTELKLTGKFYYDYTEAYKIIELTEADFLEVVNYDEI
jgi:hypothetical protein